VGVEEGDTKRAVIIGSKMVDWDFKYVYEHKNSVSIGYIVFPKRGKQHYI
jgi:hypothetical protein